MVEVSRLFDLEIYTIAGEYVGRVADVVLNIKSGTISRLQVNAVGHEEEKNIGIADIVKKGFQIPNDDEIRVYKEGLVDVEYDNVRAIGDIILIDSQEKQPEPQPQEIPSGEF